MLSSVNDDIPVASTWLDRLRLSKGISTTDDEDASGTPLSLDDFLRRNNQTETTTDLATTSSASDSPPEIPESPSDPNRGEWYGVMSNVLSELFNFGESSSKSVTKKLPRKQSNPRHCSIETPLGNNSSFLLPVVREFAPSSRNLYSKKLDRRSVVEVEEEEEENVGVDDEEEEEEKGEKEELVGFSRSEVTVIDTSFKIWKCEKLVFRRRNVWKVRDKKGKSKVVSLKKKMMKKRKKKMMMKKKKNRECDGDGEIVRKSKKMKFSETGTDNNRRYHIEEVQDEPESSNANRILLSRLPSKPRKEGSLGVHTSKKNSEPEAQSHRYLAKQYP